MTVGALGVAASCNKSEVKAPPKTTQPVITKKAEPSGPPQWIAASQSWPETMEWVLDSVGEATVDGLFMRLVVSVEKVFLGGPRADEQPLLSEVTLTVRPISRWPLAQGMVLDSIVFYDPVRKVRIPKVPMLSSRRAFEAPNVRTVFASDGTKEFTVDLDEGQLLEPTVYMTWDKRTLIVTALPTTVSFLTDLKREKEQLPDWGNE
jgi:hypothetical protein